MSEPAETKSARRGRPAAPVQKSVVSARVPNAYADQIIAVARARRLSVSEAAGKLMVLGLKASGAELL